MTELDELRILTVAREARAASYANETPDTVATYLGARHRAWCLLGIDVATEPVPC
jgi:hypothetical protein